MENEAPQMTPEQIAMMQQEQPAQEPQAPAPDEVETAKDMLGINQQQEAIATQGETINGLKSQLAQMQQKEVTDELTKKYPDIPTDLVEKEIAKLEEVNPQFAEAMRSTPEGREMAYKAVMAEITPKEKPDNLTDGEGSGETMETLEEAVKGGKADDFQLGSFILGQ